MSKTYGNMFSKVVKHLGFSNTFSDGDEETGLIKEDINDCLQEVLTLSKSYKKKSGVSISGGTVSGQRNYTIPDTVDKISSVKITSGGQDYYPDEISISSFHRLDEDSSGDIPTFFVIDKNELYIYPTPSSNSLPIELNSNIYAVDLNIDASASTDINTELDIKKGFENVIYYYVLSQAYIRLEEVGLSDRYEIKYEKLMRSYKNDVANPTNNPLVKYGETGIINPNNYPLITQ